MASLQARHSRTCELGKAWTPFNGAAHGCTCPDGPTYYVVVREGGRVHRERAGKNRRQAQRALTKIQSTVDDGEFRPQPNVTFSTWADRWLASLERKRTTRRAYAQSIDYAKSAFGDKAVRRLRAEDIARLNVSLRERGLSASTRNRHLRALHTCLQSAVRHGYAARNPVAELPPARSLGPSTERPPILRTRNCRDSSQRSRTVSTRRSSSRPSRQACARASSALSPGAT